jgi:UDP:flavonoid glycosyltransferase YjiC (YdhE family)
VTASGSGVALTEDADPDRIDELLRHLLTDPGVREACASIAAEVHAMPSAHEVAQAVLALAPVGP